MLETQHRWMKVADRQARPQGDRPWTAASLALTPRPAVRLGTSQRFADETGAARLFRHDIGHRSGGGEVAASTASPG